MKRKSIEPCTDVGDPKKKSRFKMASRSHVEENGLEDDPWTGPAKRAEVHQIPEVRMCESDKHKVNLYLRLIMEISCDRF